MGRGARGASGVPVTPEALAVAAGAAVEAGAEDVHLHPKDADGRDSLDPEHVDAAVAAVRAAVPGITVGVTTGAWVGERLEHIRMWTVPARPRLGELARGGRGGRG
jgi:uncharacterized protein (DUF849 family)